MLALRGDRASIAVDVVSPTTWGVGLLISEDGRSIFQFRPDISRSHATLQRSAISKRCDETERLDAWRRVSLRREKGGAPANAIKMAQ
jgi:hypothetical protein